MKNISIVFLLTASLCANMAPEGFERFPNNYFVETGTFLGQGIQFALRAGFPTIHSVELDHNFMERARTVFSQYSNVHIWEGDSGKILWDVIKDINEPITFWLDGHNGFPDPNSMAKNTPVIEELEQIKRHPIKTHTIIIDDMHCCGLLQFDFLTKEDIARKIMEINSAYEILYVPGGDAGEYPSNIMVARVKQNTDNHEKVFTEIYDKAVWGKNAQGAGFSGGGSLLENTRTYIAFLENFMKEHGITSVVDAGCGDWEFSRYVDWTGIHYMGYDIVGHVTEKNKALFGSPTINFEQANIVVEEFPQADLLLCKEVLQHLPNEDIIKFLQQIKKFKYCLITNEVYPQTLSSQNEDISIGGGHKIDLSCPPFNISGKKVLNYTIDGGVHQVFLIDNTVA